MARTFTGGSANRVICGATNVPTDSDFTFFALVNKTSAVAFATVVQAGGASDGWIVHMDGSTGANISLTKRGATTVDSLVAFPTGLCAIAVKCDEDTGVTFFTKAPGDNASTNATASNSTALAAPTSPAVTVGNWTAASGIDAGFAGDIHFEAIVNGLVPDARIEWLLDAMLAGAWGQFAEEDVRFLMPLLGESTERDYSGQGNHSTTITGTTVVYGKLGPMLFGIGDFPIAGGTPAASATIGFTDFDDGRVYQRAAGTSAKTITFSGTYTVTAPTTVEVQIQNHADSTVIQDWTALSSTTISGGTWSGSLSVPEGGWYMFVARGKDAGGSVIATSSTSSNKWGVGRLIAMLGQSNMYNMFNVSSTPPTTHDLTRRYNGSWGAVVGNGAIRFANQMRAGLTGTGSGGTDIPIGVLDYAVSGSGLHGSSGFGYWMDLTAGAPYPNFADALAALDDDCEAILWHQGETDIGIGTTKDQYKTDLGTLYDRILTATGRSTTTLKFGCALLGTMDDAAVTDADADPIHQAQLEWIRDTTGAYCAGSSLDMVRTDSYHWTAPYYERMGRRYAQAVLHQMGVLSTGSEGPVIASASRDSGSADIILTITQNGGAALQEPDGTTDGGSLTGFQVSDDDFATTLTISSTSFNAGTVVLTLSAAPADSDTVKVRHLYGENPTTTNLVYDDQTPQGDTLGFPLQPTIGSMTASLPSTATGYQNLLLMGVG